MEHEDRAWLDLRENTRQDLRGVAHDGIESSGGPAIRRMPRRASAGCTAGSCDRPERETSAACCGDGRESAVAGVDLLATRPGSKHQNSRRDASESGWRR